MNRAAAAFVLLTAVLGAVSAADSLFVALRPGAVPFVLLSLTVLLATGSGRALAGRLGLSDMSESQKTLAGATLGLGMLALGGMALGAVGLYKPWAASALLAALWLAGYGELKPALESLAPDRSLLRERPLAAAAVALPLLAALWMCLVPPHQYDSLVYHLALPQAYIREGRLFAPPGIVYAHFPQNGEMLFTLALLLGSDLLAQMYMWLSTVLSVWWVFALGRREAPMSAVLLAALFVATHSAVLLMSSTTYVEPLVMLWITAAALSFERARQVAPDGGAPRGWLVLSAIFTGLALGTKYYAGIGAAAFGLRLLWAWAFDRRRERAVDLLLFTAIVTALFAPWLVKNWLCVRNPVFPFLYKWFENTGTGWNADLAAGYFSVLTEYGHVGGFFKSLISLPILLLRNPLRFGGGMDVLGDLGWDVLLWLLPLGAWAASKNRALRGLLIFCALWGAAWFSSGVVLRFLTVLVPLLALLGACGLARLWEELESWGRWTLGGALGVMTAAHLFLFVFVHSTFGSGATAFGLETREEFLGRRLDYWSCADWLRTNAGPNDKILVVGEQRGYYLAASHLPSTVHMPNLFVRRANESATTAELLSSLRSEGFTRLLIVPKEAARLGVGLGSLTPTGAVNWKGLEDSLKTDFAGRGCVVGRL
ncbi:MAG: phospholipid carrier-dependent glycosyltransferase [Elusimicrobiota bacterium]|nr:MAG: phospholipid carrier-dependent glycosyltransferase [Elusimicrobiota bacterium]